MTMATNLYYHSWFAKARLQETHLVALHVVLPLRFFLFLFALHVALPLHLFPPFFFVALVLLFHSSTDTTQDIHTKTKKKNKTKPKEQRNHKNLNKNTKNKESQRPQTKLHKTKNKQKIKKEKEKPKRDFLDGGLVGAGSRKPRKCTQKYCPKNCDILS